MKRGHLQCGDGLGCVDGVARGSQGDGDGGSVKVGRRTVASHRSIKFVMVMHRGQRR